VIELKDDFEFRDWILSNYQGEEERTRVLKAWRYASRAHHNQLRRTGRPFICHPEEVAKKVKELGLPVEYAIAGLLHDVTEDCLLTLLEIYFMFGPAVRLLVLFMDKTRLCFFDDYWSKSSVFYEADPRTILLRLADSLSNLKEADGFKTPFNRRKNAWNALDLLELAYEMFPDNQKYLDFFEEIKREANKYV
jgi:GTP diphosphokinase / guanosine-3',5'-bis(diphosphate) 3'-diphosphatase